MYIHNYPLNEYFIPLNVPTHKYHVELGRNIYFLHMENAGVFFHSFKSVVSCILLFISICILLISAIWIASHVFFSSFSDLTITSLFSIIWFVAEGVCIYLFWVTKTFPSSSSGIMILPQSSSHSVFSGSAAWISSLWPCLPGHDTLFLGLSLTSVLW